MIMKLQPKAPPVKPQSFKACLTCIFFISLVSAVPILIGVASERPSYAELGDCSPTWHIDSFNDVRVGKTGLEGVEAISQNDVWAVGAIGIADAPSQTHIEHWNGNIWVAIPSRSFGLGDNSLYDVSAVSPSDIWAVGGYRAEREGLSFRTLIEHWDGASWSITPSLDSDKIAVFFGVAALAANDVWAVGDYQTAGTQHALIAHWDGTNWTEVSSPDAPSLPGLRSIAAVSSKDIWAVGDHRGQGRTLTLTEHWDGSQWSIVESPNAGTFVNSLQGVAAVDTTDVWAVGNSSDANGGNVSTLVLHWEGTQWSVVPSPNAGQRVNFLRDVSAISPQDVWAVGNYSPDRGNLTLAEHWNGKEWAIVPVPQAGFGGNQFAAVDALPSSDVWAVGYASTAAATLVAHYYQDPCPTATPPPTAVPTIAIPGDKTRTFPETGMTLEGLFLDYWESHGGLAQQGYPISARLGEVSDLDHNPYTVQYFERAVFEYHPENQTPYDVLLSQLGTFQYKEKYPSGAPNQEPNITSGSMFFPETGKRLGGTFLDYWVAHGGLAQQGYPISDEFIERSDLNGKDYRVQYFERAVFEYHPENQTPYDVLLSQLGTFRYKERYGDR